MAGHSQFKNIMHRKGRQDAVKSKMFSKLAREITVAAKMGMPDPDMNPRLRLADQCRQGAVDAEGQHPARHQQGGRRRRRELRRGPLRRLRPGRRRPDRRGADRQPQPLGVQRARRLHQGRRRARRNRLGVLHVGPRRRDLLPARGRRRRQGHGGGDRSRRRRRGVGRGQATRSTAPSKMSARFRRRWKQRSARPSR